MDNTALKRMAEELENELRMKVSSPVKVGWMRDGGNNVSFMVYGDFDDCSRHIPETWHGHPVMFQSNTGAQFGGIFFSGQLGQ
jgi:hypothetical protein